MKSSRREFLGAAAGLALAGSTKPEKIHAANAGTNQIVNIYDNIVYEAGDAIPDWGFSAYITYNGKTILFDAGTYPEIFKHNTTVFGVDLVAVDTVILSHNHMDHKGGLDYFLDAYEDYTLYLPNEWNIGGPFPTIFKKDGTYARGYSYRHRNTQYVIEHTEISNGIHIIATESPIIGTSWGYPPHEEKPLFMGLPELSLALENGTGQVILISGCSHSKIEEIVKVTKQHLDKDISLVIGGFHFSPYKDDYVVSIANMMKDELGVNRVACSHCTGEKAVAIFKEIYGGNYSAGGLGAKLMI